MGSQRFNKTSKVFVILLALFFAAILISNAEASTPSDLTVVPDTKLIEKIIKANTLPDLTGTYYADAKAYPDPDFTFKGLYYVKQIGNNVYWYGEEKPDNPLWANIAYGTISGKTITLNWADVPKGKTSNSGTLILTASYKECTPDSSITLTVEKQTGGFAGKKLVEYWPC